MITEKTVYVTRGRTFDSQEKALAHRADLIGEFMDKCPVMLGPGERIKINAFMVENRDALRALLDY